MNIQQLKGIGEKTAVPFAKAGIFNIEDLLRYYPRAYEIYESPVAVDEMEDGGKYAVPDRQGEGR